MELFCQLLYHVRVVNWADWAKKEKKGESIYQRSTIWVKPDALMLLEW